LHRTRVRCGPITGVTGPPGASFCAYVIRRIGFPGLRDLYGALKRDDMNHNAQAIEHALGQDLGTIEADWHTSSRH
jgi:hypothetical protein